MVSLKEALMQLNAELQIIKNAVTSEGQIPKSRLNALQTIFVNLSDAIETYRLAASPNDAFLSTAEEKHNLLTHLLPFLKKEPINKKEILRRMRLILNN